MTPNPNFAAYMRQCQQRVEQALQNNLPEEQISPQKLHCAMRYATLGGGKRIRPILVYAAGQAVNAKQHYLDIPACAVELIHAYSLIHDDLPGMDNDDLRRGRPTCHKAFDEATAILAGDALQTLAFHLLSKLPQDKGISPLLMIQKLAQASGSRGMAGGQSLDMSAVGESLNLVQLENMHTHKTGALICASVHLGMLCATQVDEKEVKHLDRYAKCIGLAFQVQDDVLDITSSTQTLGKTQGKDAANAKPTYPALLGLDGAREMAKQLFEEAVDNLNRFGENATPLRQLATYVVQRDH